MEKIGVEVERQNKEQEGLEVPGILKEAQSKPKCQHPEEYIKREDDVVFCERCGKYLI